MSNTILYKENTIYRLRQALTRQNTIPPQTKKYIAIGNTQD